MMGVFSSLSNAKKAVENVYDMYNNMQKAIAEQKEIEIEAYQSKLWERHPQHLSYHFYTLNQSGTAFFEILAINLNEQALSFRAPNGETLDNYINNHPIGQEIKEEKKKDEKLIN